MCQGLRGAMFATWQVASEVFSCLLQIRKAIKQKILRLFWWFIFLRISLPFLCFIFRQVVVVGRCSWLLHHLHLCHGCICFSASQPWPASRALLRNACAVLCSQHQGRSAVHTWRGEIRQEEAIKSLLLLCNPTSAISSIQQVQSARCSTFGNKLKLVKIKTNVFFLFTWRKGFALRVMYKSSVVSCACQSWKEGLPPKSVAATDEISWGYEIAEKNTTRDQIELSFGMPNHLWYSQQEVFCCLPCHSMAGSFSCKPGSSSAAPLPCRPSRSIPTTSAMPLFVFCLTFPSSSWWPQSASTSSSASSSTPSQNFEMKRCGCLEKKAWGQHSLSRENVLNILLNIIEHGFSNLAPTYFMRMAFYENKSCKNKSCKNKSCSH